MIRDPSVITVSFIIAFLLFTAGCISQPTVENQSVNASQNNSLSPFTIVKNRSQCDSQETGAPWVQINPVGDHHVGELLTINGSTNLPQGSILMIWITSTNNQNTPKNFNVTEWCIRRCMQANVTITNEICPYTTFSIAFNTTNLFADEYLVHVFFINESFNNNSKMIAYRTFNII
jgi:hypothetical protein